MPQAAHDASTPDDMTRLAVARLVERHGVAATARLLGLGREAVARIAGGLNVKRGSLALARERLPQDSQHPHARVA